MIIYLQQFNLIHSFKQFVLSQDLIFIAVVFIPLKVDRKVVVWMVHDVAKRLPPHWRNRAHHLHLLGME